MQAVSNNLNISFGPDILSNLKRFEWVLISRKILFKKIAIMPEGLFPKLKGSICNISVNTSDIVNVLPHGADSNGLVVVKLKRKLSYIGHVYLEAVGPDSIHMALKYLKENNSLYCDIRIDVNNIPNELTEMTDTIQYNKQSLSLNDKDPCDDLEEKEAPLRPYRFNS